ncbi:hypothetical protein H5410_002389 [Solanum commersonii]|uniref:Uncharacterized protein n=1 Tax=Solanum commersonii TaxID=4109 RepID=A0A9J6B1X6_SOLCO|nr:hypothetical protein H5410_002389 [Solanum commersonii]
MEMQSIVTHILLNYPGIKPYLKMQKIIHMMTKNMIMKIKQLRRKSGRLMKFKQGVRVIDLSGILELASLIRLKRRNLGDPYIPRFHFSDPERITHDTHFLVVLFGKADHREYYPNYSQPIGVSSTSQSLPPQHYEDLSLEAIHRAPTLSSYKSSTGTPSPCQSPTGISPQLSSTRIRYSNSERSDVVVGTPPLTQHYVHPGHRDRGIELTVMIKSNGSSWHPAKDAALDLKDSVKRLFKQAYQSWSQIPNNIRQAMLNKFKTLCTWESRSTMLIATTFERRASSKLSSWLKNARKREMGRTPLVHEFGQNDTLTVQSNLDRMVGGTHKGRVYCRGSQNDVRLPMSGLKAIGSSSQDEKINGVQIAAMSTQVEKMTAALQLSEQKRVAE